MTKNAKIILFTLIGLSMLGLVLYGLFYSKELDSKKETSVESNINDYLYDETKDTIDLVEEENEDLDGEEAEVEDDDFEEYDEEDGWGDEGEEEVAGKEEKQTSNTMVETETTNTIDDELEELYDNTKPEKKKEPETPKEKPTKTDKSIAVNSSGEYLVIAGSFGSTRNAEKKIKKLEDVGFTGEIVKLKGSKLNTVIAGRFSSEIEAEAYAKEVEAKGLRAIVKKE